jgi:Cytochrome P450
LIRILNTVLFSRYADSAAERIFKPWLRCDNFFKILKKSQTYHEKKNRITKFVETHVVKSYEEDFQQKRLTNSKTQKLYLDYVYQLRETITYEQMVEEVLMFMGAAFETSGKAIPATLLLLAMNSTEQDKVLDEIRSVLSSELDDIDEEKLNQMVYLDLVIKESLRMIPPGIMFSRQAAKDVELSEN